MNVLLKNVYYHYTNIPDHLLALKDLFEQLMKEMVHVKRILSRNNISNVFNAGENPQNNPGKSICVAMFPS